MISIATPHTSPWSSSLSLLPRRWTVTGNLGDHGNWIVVRAAALNDELSRVLDLDSVSVVDPDPLTSSVSSAWSEPALAMSTRSHASSCAVRRRSRPSRPPLVMTSSPLSVIVSTACAACCLMVRDSDPGSLMTSALNSHGSSPGSGPSRRREKDAHRWAVSHWRRFLVMR